MRHTGSLLWDHVADGDGGDCGVNRADPTRVYHSYYGMGMEPLHGERRLGFLRVGGPERGQHLQRALLPPDGGERLHGRSGGPEHLRLAQPGHVVDGDEPPGGVATAMCASMSDRIYVGMHTGAIYRVDWGGTSWTVATITSPRAAWVSDIAVDPSNALRVWTTSTVPGGGRVFRSDDGGFSYTDVSAGLPGLPINAIEIDPTNGNRAWVAADLGVYETWDAGATWSAISSGLPNSLVTDLVFHLTLAYYGPVLETAACGSSTSTVRAHRGAARNGMATWPEPDRNLVHLQLAGVLARHLDGDADDGHRGCGSAAVVVRRRPASQ